MGNAPGLSIPGKVFLIGEYAVLTGACAWLAAVPPRFELRAGSLAVPFAPESPAGRFLAGPGKPIGETKLTGDFFDPWEGRGGFGGSTAEFAFAAYRAGLRGHAEVWRAYRELSAGEPSVRRPSGADLVAQWVGGSVEWNPGTETTRDLTGILGELPVLIFSATHLPNRKTVTHAHLDTLASASLSFESLLPSLERAQNAAASKNWREVGLAFSAFADSLSHLGLESPVVRNERLAIARLSGVLGVKGCGSLQTDAMLVVVESLASPETDAVIAYAAEKCSLRLLARGLPGEAGIREEIAL
jgi:hypothetical protein